MGMRTESVPVNFARGVTYFVACVVPPQKGRRRVLMDIGCADRGPRLMLALDPRGRPYAEALDAKGKLFITAAIAEELLPNGFWTFIYGIDHVKGHPRLFVSLNEKLTVEVSVASGKWPGEMLVPSAIAQDVCDDEPGEVGFSEIALVNGAIEEPQLSLQWGYAQRHWRTSVTPRGSSPPSEPTPSGYTRGVIEFGADGRGIYRKGLLPEVPAKPQQQPAPTEVDPTPASLETAKAGANDGDVVVTPFRPNKNARANQPTHSKRFFLDTVADLRGIVQRGDPYRLTRASLLVRQLVCDGSSSLFNQANTDGTSKLRFDVLPFDLRLPNTTFGFGLHLAGTAPHAAGRVSLDIDHFLKTIVCVLSGTEITALDVVDFFAHVFGGAHFGQAKNEKQTLLLKFNPNLYDGSSLCMTVLRQVSEAVLEACRPLEHKLLRIAGSGSEPGSTSATTTPTPPSPSSGVAAS